MTKHYLQSARNTIATEIDGIKHMQSDLDGRFEATCELLLACKGRVIVSGMGKSGHIARKISSSLASTGTPAQFVHPGEAAHGDLGMITANDVVILLSNSGKAPEMLTLLTPLRRLGVNIVAITGDKKSPMAEHADIHLYAGVPKEACPLNLAPTASTTAALVLGDALTIALLEARGFSADDFGVSHPGGSLGKRLLLQVKDVMHEGDDLPLIPESATLQQALAVMTAKRLGLAIVCEQNKVIGVFTDGDLRRCIEKRLDLYDTPIIQVMTPGGRSIAGNALAATAMKQMEEYEITSLIVSNNNTEISGVIALKDLLHAGVM